MNNTKWREVFGVLHQLKIRFAFRLQSEEPRSTDDRLYSANPRDIGIDGITDPGFGGPFHYRAIAELLVPRSYVVIDRFRESHEQRRVVIQPIEDLELELNKLGKLPLQRVDEGLRIVA